MDAAHCLSRASFGDDLSYVNRVAADAAVNTYSVDGGTAGPAMCRKPAQVPNVQGRRRGGVEASTAPAPATWPTVSSERSGGPGIVMFRAA